MVYSIMLNFDPPGIFVGGLNEENQS